MNPGYVIISAILGIIGFLLVRFINSVDALKKTVEKVLIELSGKNAACSEKHIAINSRLKGHDTEIKSLHDKFEGIDKEVSILKTK